jgi:hypothetical protein
MGVTMETTEMKLPTPAGACSTGLARVLAGTLIAFSVALAAASPAMADDNNEHGEGGNWHRKHHRPNYGNNYYYGGGYYYQPQYYYQPPVVYVQPAPVYVAPPPPPVYYAPYPPSVNFVFPLKF